MIQQLLTEGGAGGVSRGAGPSRAGSAAWRRPPIGTTALPETYVGYDRTENLASPGGAPRDQRQVYTVPGAA